MSRLTGKVAVVTGGASGIGRAVAEAMAAEGAKVAIGDRSGAGAAEAAAAIEAAGGSAIGMAADVTVRDDVEALAGAAQDGFGTPSVVFCSAGIIGAGGSSDFLELTDAEWSRVLEVNLGGTFVTSQVCARLMVAAGIGGSIVTVSSIGVERPAGGATAYHASKGGVVGLTRALAVNLAPHRIRVNAIAPGHILTGMTQDVVEDSAVEEAVVSRVPAHRMGVPEDLAGVAVLLASDAADYVTGQTIHVDGGALVLGWTPSEPPA